MDNEFSDFKNVKIVSAFSRLTDEDFQGEKNAICWYRHLNGDFAEIVSKLTLVENLSEISMESLMALQLSDEGSAARAVIMSDFQLLTDFGALPSLNLIKNYERDEEFEIISTDVYSFHVDRSPIGIDTFLCTYHGTSSEILANDQAEQKIMNSEIRRKLKKLHDGPVEEFESFLIENYFDLHYQPKSDAQPISLGKGHMWRLAVDHPDKQVLPCIHRAPKENDGEYRLLLIC
ncbi:MULTISPECIES: DUF1826 domain-containing protein [Pedobacter]|uniref:DUF1826 domain-containing protein n=1 Tax=Pedobacter TaxID=84567 RepID=UPI001E452651|nr:MULTISPECIES: DUF1826 domain-containing protein [Pedobacter]